MLLSLRCGSGKLHATSMHAAARRYEVWSAHHAASENTAVIQPKACQKRSCCFLQLELQHVASLHLAGGIFEERPAAALTVAQLFGALQAHLAAAGPGDVTPVLAHAPVVPCPGGPCSMLRYCCAGGQDASSLQASILHHLASAHGLNRHAAAVAIARDGPLAAALKVCLLHPAGRLPIYMHVLTD